LSLINAALLGTPRILFAVGRDGLLSGRAAQVSSGGTPRVALAITALAAALFILSGTLEQLVAVAAVLFVLNYLSAYGAVMRLRVREPELERPFRVFGYPWTTLIVFTGAAVFLWATVLDDLRSGSFALALTALSIPAYAWIQYRKKRN
jgi:APA family basic amino acid/polyamine antiporter